MLKTRWLRFGLASVILACAGSSAVLIACGDDDDNGTTPGPDTGTSDTGNSETGSNDAGTDSTTPPKPANAKIIVVNAATDFGPNADIGPAKFQAIRVCFAVGASAAGATITPVPPQPDEGAPGRPPGIYIGTGGIFKSFGLDLGPLTIVPYIMNAATLAAKGILKPGPGNPGTTCDEILKPGATLDGGVTFTENVDYWKLPPIPANTLQTEKSYALVLTGCTNDAVGQGEKCGDGFVAGDAGSAATGNLRARIYELDRTATPAADAIGAQFIHASAAGAWFLNGNNPGSAVIPVVAGFANDNAGGGYQALPGPGDGGATAYGEKTALKSFTGINAAANYFTINPLVPYGAPLPIIQASSFPLGVPDGGAIRNGASFTFFAVGDPTVDSDAGGTPNPRAFHYLAFPNDPPVQVYAP